MEYRLLKEENFKLRTWPGGTSKEMAVFPQDAHYERQDFIWRLSSAEVLQEEAVFTKLPDYERVLMVLEGDVVLAYEGQRVVRLKELEQDRFDGGYSTKSFGKIRDYNLMVRKGALGYLDVLKPSGEKQVPACEAADGFAYICQAFYCHEGYSVITIGSESCMVAKGEQLVICQKASEFTAAGVMGEGTLIRAQIYYNEVEVSQPELEEPSEKGTLADFKECMKLSLTNFRGSRYVFRYLKNVWYDESLQQGIQKIERFYLPLMLWFLGIAVIGFYTGIRYEPLLVLCALIVWSLLMALVLSPLLYFLVVPKPVKAHIKKLEDLTQQEKDLRQAELDANPMTDKILKKYKITGRNVYIEDERPRRRKKR